MFIKLPSLIPFPHYHSCFRNIQLNQIFSLFRYLKLDFFSSGDRISHTQESITFLKLIHHLILIHLLIHLFDKSLQYFIPLKIKILY